MFSDKTTIFLFLQENMALVAKWSYKYILKIKSMF